MGRGALIVFEGLDRAGKTTQCEALVQRMQDNGKKVKHIRFPERSTTIGQMIDGYLKGSSQLDNHAVHLLFSANRWEIADTIRQDLLAGTVVVLDRYSYSGCVYSAAKKDPSLTLAWARKPDEGLPRPDLVVFLDISPEQAAKRGGFGGERYEESEMQGNVRELFKTVLASKDGADFVSLDGAKDMAVLKEEIHDLCVSAMTRVDEQKLPLRSIEP